MCQLRHGWFEEREGGMREGGREGQGMKEGGRRERGREGGRDKERREAGCSNNI